MSKLPLLIQGLFENENQTGQTVVPTPGVVNSWVNKTQEGRGNMVMLDVMPTGSPGSSYSNLGILNLRIGSYKVLQNVDLSGYLNTSYSRSYELLQLVQPPAQTIQLSIVPVNGLSVVGAVVHAYYENEFATPAIIAARNTSVLKQRVVEFRQSFAFGTRIIEGNKITVPTGIGNVVGIEFICNDDFDNPGDAFSTSLISCSVDSTSILQNASSNLFLPASARPGLIFPIFIKGGSTINFYINTIYATSGNIIVGVRLYFDSEQ